MVTTITAPMRRPSFLPDMFADITPAKITFWNPDGGGMWSIVFDGDLTDAQREAVVARMTSRDDEDMANRKALADALGKLEATPLVNKQGNPTGESLKSTVEQNRAALIALAKLGLGRDL